jgi:pimeloyl-ACP methyl ester carboxylesterase
MAPPQPPSSTTGVLHHVAPVSAFEISNSSSSTPNLLLWIGGLTDTYHSVSYVYTLAASLPTSWSLAQVNLSSAGSGWGISSLGQDVNELSSLIHYFHTQGKQKVVVMGHSTGCQDCLHFFASPDKRGDRAKVDGVILQASVSDREAIAMDMPTSDLENANSTAKEWCSNGEGEHILPLTITASNFGHNPVTARRWVSLACKGGEDDYFSSDLDDQTLAKTFGKIDKPLLILYGEEDEYVPS